MLDSSPQLLLSQSQEREIVVLYALIAAAFLESYAPCPETLTHLSLFSFPVHFATVILAPTLRADSTCCPSRGYRIGVPAF